MPADSEKTRVYVSGRKAPIIVDAQFDAVATNIREAVQAGEPFVEYESAGRRFREGRVAIRVEKIVGLREDMPVEEHLGLEDPEDTGEHGEVDPPFGGDEPAFQEEPLGDGPPLA